MKIVVTALTALALGVAASHAAEPAGISETDSGRIYTDANGMALYTYDRDSAGVSNCYDDCAANWPPFAAEAGAVAEGEWTLVERTDGSMMWAYDGMPLYTYVTDMAPGDVTGDGAGGVWHVLKAE